MEIPSKELKIQKYIYELHDALLPLVTAICPDNWELVSCYVASSLILAERENSIDLKPSQYEHALKTLLEEIIHGKTNSTLPDQYSELITYAAAIYSKGTPTQLRGIQTPRIVDVNRDFSKPFQDV